MEPNPEIDDLIAAARRTAPSVDEPPIDDGLLLAWRAGRLSPEAVEQVEARLARDPEARALARALQEPPPAALSAWAEARRPRRISPWVLAAAAALIFGIGLGVRALIADPPAPAYRAGPLEGSVRTMMAGDDPGTGVFLPDSVLRVGLRPVDERASAPPIHIYADTGAALVRVRTAEITTGAGGAARVEVVAREAFGEAFGQRRLVVVLGAWPDPPATLPRDADGGGRLWLRLPVDYRPELQEVP